MGKKWERRSRLTGAALLLAAATWACGPLNLGGKQQEGETTITDDGAALIFTGLNLQQYDTYGASYDLGYTGQRPDGVAVDIQTSGDIQSQRDPKLTSVQSETSGSGMIQGISLLDRVTELTTLSTEVITADTTIYLMASALGQNECRSLDTSTIPVKSALDNLELGNINIDQFIHLKPSQAPLRLELLGSEDINGLATDHYQALNAELGSLTVGDIDIWYAPSEKRIARLALDGEANIPLYGSGSVTVVYDITDVNQPVSINLPTDCPPINLEDLHLPDLPSLPGG